MTAFSTLVKLVAAFVFIQITFHLLSKPLQTISEYMLLQQCCSHQNLTVKPENPCNAEISPHNTIWMLETKFTYPKPRALCGVESVTLHMPNWCIRLLITDYHEDNPNNSLANDLLRTYKNVVVSKLNPREILRNTPLENFTDPKLKSTVNYINDLSDALRASLMYKYGGIFLDLDIIAVKSFETPSDYLTRLVTGGVIGSVIIKASRPLEPVFWLTMDSGRAWYNKYAYASLMNGFATGIRNYCRSLGISVKPLNKQDRLVEKCGNFYILGANSSGMCYPYWMYEFVPSLVQKQFQQLEAENCSFLHWYQTFNKHWTLNLTEDYDFFFAQIAQKFCPKLYRSVTLF